MQTEQYEIFETTLGTCAIAFGRRGIVAVGLPEKTQSVLLARFDRLARRLTGPVPAGISGAIVAIQTHLSGDLQDLSRLEVDLGRVPSFDRRVYECAKRIAPGQTQTYGDLASEVGDRELARKVGQSLGRNPVPLIIPCHRVVQADRRLGGFSAAGGAALKFRLLAIEKAFGSQLSMPFN
jgi:methylated-DNA-[protein]-cysteine S-methyltransferase